MTVYGMHFLFSIINQKNTGMKKLALLLLLLSALMNASSLAYFGDPHFFEQLNVEEQGIPENLAYLIAYSDAVVVAEHRPDDIPHISTVTKVVNLKAGISLQAGDKIYFETHPSNYFDNKRTIDYDITTVRRTHDGLITYLAPLPLSLRAGKKGSLLFLRASEMNEKIRDRKRLHDTPIFKTTNGSDGQILLDAAIEESGRNDAGGEIKKGNEYEEMLILRQKKIWGIRSGEEFLTFIEAFFSKNGLSKDQIHSVLGERLQKDSIELVKALSRDEMNRHANQ